MRSVCYVLAPCTHFSLLTPSSTPPNSDARGGESIAGWARFEEESQWRQRLFGERERVSTTTSSCSPVLQLVWLLEKLPESPREGGVGSREGQGGTGRVSSASDQLMNETKYQAQRGESRAIVARGRTTSRARTWG